MHGAFHPRADTLKQYIYRKDRGQAFLFIEDYVDQAVLRLQNYAFESTERTLCFVRAFDAIELDGSLIESTNDWKERKQRERKHEWTQKVLHGQFVRQTVSLADAKSQLWLQEEYLKSETEDLIIIAAQYQALRTNLIKTGIDEAQDNPVCRMCKKIRVQHMPSVASVNQHRRNINKDTIMWERLSIGNWAGKKDLNLKKGGMTIPQKMFWKMTIERYCWILPYK